MIELRHLTKRYGSVVAVDDLSVDVAPGGVTGFLGPNGAGKSTTMRLILGLDRPTGGTALVDGRPYRDTPRPLRAVGALLEAAGAHPGRRVRDHLLWLAQTNRIPVRRIDDVLDQVALTGVAGRRAGTLSLGQSQRLGIAAALLGDPHTLLLDEPTNGLDPEGIVWLRGLLRSLAGAGRTVLVSSHLVSEVAQVADHLVVIAKGHLVADTTVAAFVGSHGRGRVRVRSPHVDRLAALLAERGLAVEVEVEGEIAVEGEVAAGTPDVLTVTGSDPAQIGEIAASHGLSVHELTVLQPSLEDAFMAATGEANAR